MYACVFIKANKLHENALYLRKLTSNHNTDSVYKMCSTYACIAVYKMLQYFISKGRKRIPSDLVGLGCICIRAGTYNMSIRANLFSDFTIPRSRSFQLFNFAYCRLTVTLFYSLNFDLVILHK